MKLLVDTSVWSLALRRKNTAGLSPDEQKLKAELVQAIQDGRVAMLGLLRQELLSGIKEKAQFDKVKAALSPYLDEPITAADHEYAARVHNECRNHGIQAGTVDILICAVAVRRGWEVLSGDSGLNRCLAVTKKFHEKQKRTSATEEVKIRRTSRK
ncbi:MAG: PIN domain-containing protein [Acidobacteriaceae bacterium]